MLDYKEDMITAESSLVDYKQHNLDNYLRKMIRLEFINMERTNDTTLPHTIYYDSKIYIKLLRTNL